MAPPLPEVLEEEILVRFPPKEPALLVRASLVCKRWRRLVSSPAFRRRLRDLYGAPPMLGFVCNAVEDDGCKTTASFVTSTQDVDLGRCRAIDARHGRVLLQRPGIGSSDEALVVWDPIADERRKLPVPPRYAVLSWTAAVVCAGTCDHIDCHRGPFLVVFLGSATTEREAFICTYSSDASTWTDPIATELPSAVINLTPGVLVGNALYFAFRARKTLVKYDLESHEMSLIQVPPTCSRLWHHVVIGGGLALAIVDESKLCIWGRAGPEDDAGWTQNRVIELKTLLPSDAFLISPKVVGFAAGIDVIFLKARRMLFTVDLKTCEVKKVCEGKNIFSAIPYVSFYTPAPGAACTDEGSSVCASGALKASGAHVRASSSIEG